MKIISGALIALALSLAEAATDGALRGKSGAQPAGLQVEGPYKDLYDKAKDQYTDNKDEYDDAAKDWYGKGKDHYEKNKVEYKELLKTSLPASAMATVEKIADALCSVDESPDLHYAVKLAKRIYNCDEEATGMIANLATTVVAESLVLKSRSNHNGLAVSDEWAGFYNEVASVVISSAAPAIHCAWVWGGWGSCSKTCGGGRKSRSVVVKKWPARGGKPCPSESQTIACNTGTCGR